MKQIKVKNPANLPVRPHNELHEFQGDFKKPITLKALEKLKNSLIKHGVFVPKFVWCDGAKACVIDGHQTLAALNALKADGWEIPPIPYVEVQAESREDAAEKLLQINSRYAVINPESEWLMEIEGIDEILARIEIPEIPDIKIDETPGMETEDKIDEMFNVLIECETEAKQVELLNEFNERGLKCKALIL